MVLWQTPKKPIRPTKELKCVYVGGGARVFARLFLFNFEISRVLTLPKQIRGGGKGGTKQGERGTIGGGFKSLCSSMFIFIGGRTNCRTKSYHVLASGGAMTVPVPVPGK